VNQLYSAIRKNWFVAVSASDLKNRPVAVTVLGVPLVISRLGSDVLVAEDRCPHRNAPLSLGYQQQGMLKCPYHGWAFDSKGKCRQAPGLASGCLPTVGLNCWQSCEQDNWIWVAPPGTPVERRPYQLPFADSPKMEDYSMKSELHAEFADSIENLLDGTHTPFVHQGLIRKATNSQSFVAQIRRNQRGVEVEYRGEGKQQGLISRVFEAEREVSFGRFIAPCSAELEYRSKRRTELFVAAHFTPVDAERTKVFISSYLPKSLIPKPLKKPLVNLLFGRVLKQDKWILERQSENCRKFKQRTFSIWQADVIRPWLDAWVRDGILPSQIEQESQVEFLL
jgi:phenylpropionate dioxygenase-like ring-hydroxylating dioxygenase large terminal subunit